MRISRISALAVLGATVTLLSVVGIVAAATNPDVDWSATFGSPGDTFEWAGSVEQTADGGYILGGGVGTGFGGADTDAWLIKTDASGNQQWSRTFDRGGWDVANDAVQTSDGGYVVVGNSSAMVGWNWTYDCLLIKTDASGNQQWVKTFGGDEYDRFAQVLQTPDGGYVIAGVTLQASGDGDAWLMKTDASGNELWSRAYDGLGADSVNALVRTSDGGFALAGNTGVSGAAGVDGWLVRVDASGNRMWAKVYPGRSTGWEEFYSVEQTGDGGYILAGQSESASHEIDAWVVKSDASGNQQWSTYYGSLAAWSSAQCVFDLPGGGYLVAGTTAQTLGQPRLWLFTLNAGGGRLWDQAYSGGNPVGVQAGTRTSDGGYALAGDTSLNGQGLPGNAAWLVKIKSGSPGGGTTTTTQPSSTTTTTLPPSTTTTTQPPPGSNTFWDVPATHPYHDAIEGMADAQVINGYPDGSFGPDTRVWRQHFAKMIVGTLGLPCSEADVCPFWDVDLGGQSTLYPDNYIATAASWGITNGLGGGRFGPYKDITRAQVITMVVRAAEKYMGTLRTPDSAYYGGWGLFRGLGDPTHGYNAQLAEFNGLLTGIKGSGDPATWIWQPATRGEVAQILWNLSNAGLAG